MKILITDKVDTYLIEELQKDGFAIDYKPKLSLASTSEIIHAYQGIIVNSKTICDRKLIDRAKNLKFIGRLGSGLEIIETKYAESKSISVIRTPDGNCDAVAEHALGMLLSLLNNFNRARRQLRDLNWQREQNRGLELAERTVGIIGYGHTGPAFHKLLHPFGTKVLIYDKYKPPFNTDIILNQIVENADVISLHLPLTAETKEYINRTFIRRVRHPFFLINTSRGQHVVLNDLLDGLNDGQILGAGLDVFENEKISSFSAEEMEKYRDLFDRDNVICTPHVAGWTKESLRKIAESMVRQIRMLNLTN